MSNKYTDPFIDLNIPGLKGGRFSSWICGFDKMNAEPFSWLKGKTLRSIYGLEGGSGVAVFNTVDGDSFILYHEQDCCESVTIDDVCGDVSDLIGCEILDAEETDNSLTLLGTALKHAFCKRDNSETWTFYKIRTKKGYVDIRWYGTSNGYYSERVNTFLLTAEEKIAYRKKREEQAKELEQKSQKELDETEEERQFWRDAYTDLKMRMSHYFDFYAEYLDGMITMKGLPDDAVLKINDIRREIKESRKYLENHVNIFDKKES